MAIQNYDVAVIGSGISGMTAALLFAKKGKKVALFEQAPHLAPLFSGFDRGGVHIESGFHYSGVLGKDEIGGLLFKELGLNMPVELCSKDGYDDAYLLKSGRLFKFPFGRQLFEQKLIEFFPNEKDGIKKYLDLAYSQLEKIPFLNFHKREYKSEEFFYFADDKTTLSEVLNDCFKDEEIKSLLSFSSVLYGVPPSKVAFVLHCCCSGIMFETVWKIKGGGAALVKEFKRVIENSGIAVFCNKKVVKIEVEKDKKKLTFADSSQILCDICVSSIHPKEFLKIAPPETYRAKNVERIQSLPETDGFFVLYGKVKDGFRVDTNNVGFLTGDSFQKDHKNAYYINFSNSNPQAVCAVMAVDSDEKLWDIPQNEYEQKKKEISQNIKDEIKNRKPELFDKIEFLGIATPKTQKRFVNYYGSYGIMHTAESANILPITKVGGLFVVGQATIAPGLIGAMISSFLLDKIIDRSLENKNV
ncbi:MAG: NAD(P)/FAD-dependent oxidoreductase [Endomicrobium sp.]|jgi:all-trans-retinol 13,14-reductase|nr:NAD(P)/FAD-dependent oxidoreductase [Endomicrobium sp.]